MLRNIQIPSTSFSDEDDQSFRDIHAMTPPRPSPPPPPPPPLPLPPSRRSSNLSVASDVSYGSSENFTTMSREFNALVIAGSNNIDHDQHQQQYQHQHHNTPINLDRIGEDDEETSNALAIVPDSDINPLPDLSINSNSNINGSSLGHLLGSSSNNSSSNNTAAAGGVGAGTGGAGAEMVVHRVKKEEVDAKITAWETAKIAKLNNRFKRENAVITGWENEQVNKASSSMARVERKLEEKRAKAMEKMQNEIAKARRKAEERRASAEGKRGTKAAKVLEVANLMRTLGKPPAKHSFF